MCFYKVAYWVKSGPFLASNRSRPIRGQAPNISWPFPRKKNSFYFWLNLLMPVSLNLSKFMCFYKVAYWLKSGPFLASNRSRPIRGQAPNISLPFRGKKNSFYFWLNLLIPVSVNLSKFMCFYKVAYWVKSGPFLASNRSRPIRGQAPNISWPFRGKKIPSIFD
jgi:hypothetical protein